MRVELAGVSIERGGRVLLRDVNARLEAGTFTAIVGANGVGKSSLLAALCGTRAPLAGRVLLDGADLYARSRRERARAIALVDPTEGVFGRVRVDDAVAGARFPYHRWWEWEPTAADREAVDAALRACDLDALRARGLDTLSAGERQRVWLALALAQEAPVIALDEPTSHLDLRYAIDTLERLQRLARNGCTVVAVLHALEEAAAFADRAIVLGDGGVLADAAPADAFDSHVLRAAFGVDVRVVRHGGSVWFERKQTGPAGDAAGPEGSSETA